MPQISKSTNIPYAFFGSSRLSIIVLDELYRSNHKPALIITTPDKPQGRKLEIKPNVVKEWAIAHGIPVLDPVKLDDAFLANLKLATCDLFIVASYGKIIPKAIIDLPIHKTLNIHPSLLPKYRGASPLPTAMLDDDKKTGITIIQLDAEMDHGPIVAQKEINLTDHFADWPIYEDFEEMMAKEGARLLIEIMPDWIAGKIKPKEQDHSKATYTKKITKEDGLIEITPTELSDTSKIPTDRAYGIFRKIQAFHQWPQAYLFIERKDDSGISKKESAKTRIKITSASFKDDILTIEKAIPEGKKEMSYKDFARSYIN